MQTIKTGVVVALLLAVCYGAFVALNTPEANLPDELLSEFDWSPADADLGGLTNVEMPESAPLAGQPSPSADLSSSSGLPAFDASQLNLPSLPPLGNNASSESFPSHDLAGNLPSGLPGATSTQPTAAGAIGAHTSLPPLPFASAAAAPSTTSSATAAGGQLPAGPLPGEKLPGANPLSGGAPIAMPAADGPAVSLAVGNAAAAGSNGPSSGLAGSAIPGGQLVSQTRAAVPTADPPTGQLPLLNTAGDKPIASESAQQEQPPLPFPAAREQALELASSGKLREALLVLSRYYDSPELSAEQHSDMIDLLDALSREVIYSPRHLVQEAYTAVPGDTVESLALKHQITPELLNAINGLGSSKVLLNGSRVKVLSGPFRAQVSLSRHELTVFMGELYAGRFPVSFGTDPTPVEGTYEVIDRRRDRTYYGTGGKVIGASDHRNPYGGYWINLGQDLCIHGTPEMASDDLEGAGCISLAPLDAADVYNILAQSSQVSIVR